MKHTRTGFLLAVALVAARGTSVAQQPTGEVYTSADGQFKARFPGKPKGTPQTTKSALGDLKVTVATYATADANVFLVSYTDFPVAATKPENRKTLFDGVRDGVKAKGELASEKDTEFGPDKLPAREVTVDRDKGKQRVKLRAILRENRLYQVAVIGTPDFVTGKDATAFLDSLELTK